MEGPGRELEQALLEQEVAWELDEAWNLSGGTWTLRQKELKDGRYTYTVLNDVKYLISFKTTVYTQSILKTWPWSVSETINNNINFQRGLFSKSG